MLRARQRIGKYQIERRLGEGAFAAVYQARDTVEGIRVAIKVPHTSMMSQDVLKDFQNEARMVARMEHPNILPLKDANFVDGKFLIVSRLGETTLAERLKKRLAFETAIELFEQMLEAVAYAHRMKIVHCDVKPENMLLVSGNRLLLTDFGIAKVARNTLRSSGTGTVGYMAPEQAMGRPSMRSDVFSLGLIFCRMLSSRWPEWPFDWPPPGYPQLRRKAHPELVQFLKRAVEPLPRKRFRDADEMLKAFRKIKPRALRFAARRRR